MLFYPGGAAVPGAGQPGRDQVRGRHQHPPLPRPGVGRQGGAQTPGARRGYLHRAGDEDAQAEEAGTGKLQRLWYLLAVLRGENVWQV